MSTKHGRIKFLCVEKQGHRLQNQFIRDYRAGREELVAVYRRVRNLVANYQPTDLRYTPVERGGEARRGLKKFGNESSGVLRSVRAL